jgi:hypothetical protein
MTFDGLTACRPASPQAECWRCTRHTLPTEHVGPNGKTIAHLCMDPRAVLPRGRPCPLVELGEFAQVDAA